MRAYELTLVIDPDLSSEDTKKLIAKTKKIVEALKGKVEATTDWGRRELAYPIKKRQMGSFMLWDINLPETAVSPLDKKLKVEEKAIRYLLVRKETPRQARGKGDKHGAKVAQ